MFSNKETSQLNMRLFSNKKTTFSKKKNTIKWTNKLTNSKSLNPSSKKKILGVLKNSILFWNMFFIVKKRDELYKFNKLSSIIIQYSFKKNNEKILEKISNTLSPSKITNETINDIIIISVMSLGYNNEKFCSLFSFLTNMLFGKKIDADLLHTEILNFFNEKQNRNIEEIKITSQKGGIKWGLSINILLLVCNFIYLLLTIENFKTAGNEFLSELYTGKSAKLFKKTYSFMQMMSVADSCYIQNMEEKMTVEQELAYLFKPEVVQVSKELLVMIKCFHKKTPVEIISNIMTTVFLENYIPKTSNDDFYENADNSEYDEDSENNVDKNVESNQILIPKQTSPTLKRFQLVPITKNEQLVHNEDENEKLVETYASEIVNDDSFIHFQNQLVVYKENFLKTLNYDELQENLKQYKNKTVFARAILNDVMYTEYLYELQEKNETDTQKTIHVKIQESEYVEMMKLIGNIGLTFGINTIKWAMGQTFKNPISLIVDEYYDQITKMMDTLEDNYSTIRRLIRDSMREIIKTEQPIKRCMYNFTHLLNSSGMFIVQVFSLIIHTLIVLKTNKTKKNVKKISPVKIKNTSPLKIENTSPLKIENNKSQE